MQIPAPTDQDAGRPTGILPSLNGSLYENDPSRFVIEVDGNIWRVNLHGSLDYDYPQGFPVWQINIAGKDQDRFLQV